MDAPSTPRGGIKMLHLSKDKWSLRNLYTSDASVTVLLVALRCTMTSYKDNSLSCFL